MKKRLSDRALHTDGGTAGESVLDPCGLSLSFAQTFFLQGDALSG